MVGCLQFTNNTPKHNQGNVHISRYLSNWTTVSPSETILTPLFSAVGKIDSLAPTDGWKVLGDQVVTADGLDPEVSKKITDYVFAGLYADTRN